jgi:pyruvate/2-oxoglutarate dehydrogenase complex dihydrolipoamide dehydrogenase (E3) component
MTQVCRARETGETEGFMKVLVDAETKNSVAAGDRVR